MSIEQLNHDYTQIHPNNLLELRHKIIRLRQIHHTLIQEKLMHEYTKRTSEKTDEQLQIKNKQISIRVTNILKRMKINEVDFKDNYQYIMSLGKTFS
jgi:hypothetical protein